MEQSEKRLSFRILLLIAEPKLTKKAEKMFRAGGVPVLYRLAAKGTATSDMMDILGLGGIDKTMIVTMLPTPFAREMLRRFREELRLYNAGSGIAFTLPMSGINHFLLQMLNQAGEAHPVLTPEKRREIMAGAEYSLIAAIINQGCSDAVVEAARAVGARGGTVLHSRRAGSEQALSFWGLSLQEEKEIVLIAAEKEKKHDIMKAIGEKCGMHSEAQGVLLSMPIDDMTGF